MKAKVDMVEEARNLTIKVEIKRAQEFRIRVWIALKLVKLAVKIANFTYCENNGWKKGYNPPPSSERPTITTVASLPKKSETKLVQNEIIKFLRSAEGRKMVQQTIR